MAFSVSELAAWTGGKIVNPGPLGDALALIRVDRPAPLGVSRSSDIAFFFNREYERELMTAAPGVLLTGTAFVRPLESAGLPLWSKSAVLACDDPYLAMAILTERFADTLSSVAHVRAQSSTDIHPSAVLDPSVEVGVGARIGAHCVIEVGAKIGAGAVLYPGCHIGPRASVGEGSVLFAGVTLYEWTQVGRRARLHAGCVLGSDGFGYAPRRSASGGPVEGHQKIFHLGRVIVGDDVEIGANSCVDRGTLGDTVIGDRVKLDNLVHIGHNARLAEGAIVCGGTCLAGSASLGRYVYVGGLTGITNKVHVGDGASVGALALVTKDVAPGATAVGNPQREYREHFRAHAALNRLASRKRKDSDTKE